jgi:hypothetical protein
MECELPGCRESATRVMNGTNLCQDCWEKERAKMNDIYDSMP